ncbi:MAG: hypothetical protein DSY43_05470 [Gammaproteobacteria bacterium]|nr:MAG: hypothetical protein DSY43_05470 [Gammaproteobacteria bacterium]
MVGSKYSQFSKEKFNLITLNYLFHDVIHSYGWLIDGTVRYPIFYQPTNPNCGGMDPPSIRGSTVVYNKNTSKFNVYCYKEIGRTK